MGRRSGDYGRKEFAHLSSLWATERTQEVSSSPTEDSDHVFNDSIEIDANPKEIGLQFKRFIDGAKNSHDLSLSVQFTGSAGAMDEI